MRVFLSALAVTVVFVYTPYTATALQSGYLAELSAGGGRGATTISSPFTNAVQAPSSISDLYSTAPPRAAAPAFTSQPQPAFTSPPASAASSEVSELLQLWSNQVSVELAASQLYLSASIWFRLRHMEGMSAWMLEESDEERGHGFAILEFAMQNEFPVVLETLQAPKRDWQTPTQVWESILEAEQTNTQNLLRLSAVAQQCGLSWAVTFLEPFHEEQDEAEEKVGGILDRVREATMDALQLLDYELGQEEDDH